MDKMTSRLAATALVGGLAVLGAGCAAAPAAGHPGSAAATSSALPNPFTILARYSAMSLGLDHPDSFAVGPDGNLYVTDLSQRVTVISPAGKVLRRWGKPGTAPGEFKFIASDPTIPANVTGRITAGRNGMVYISDSGNARLQVFTRQGRFVRQFGSFGSGKGQFVHPFDVAVDNAGNVYVADDQRENVSKFSAGGKVIWQIGGASGDPDLIGHHHFSAFDTHGRLVMVNDDEQKLLYVDAAGHKVDAFSPNYLSLTGGHVCEATVDAAGNTYLSGCGESSTEPSLVYDRAHRLIAKWPGTRYSLLRSPVFGPNGEVFALATDGSILRLRITLPTR
jgi:6-bladed beta-propeller